MPRAIGTYFGALKLALLFLLLGCSGSRKLADQELQWYSHYPWESASLEDHYVFLEPEYPPVCFDRYFTWKYADDSSRDPYSVVFIWQGEDVGVGIDGFRNILTRMSALPPGTRILVYPNYEYTRIWGGFGESLPYTFGGYPYRDLRPLVMKRKLILLFSQRDHTGRLCDGVADRLKFLNEHGYYGRPLVYP